MRRFRIKVDEEIYEVEVEEIGEEKGREESFPSPGLTVALPKVKTAEEKSQAKEAPTLVGEIQIKAPMPGTVLEVKVKVGERVDAGQPLLKLEAMKMELDIPASKAGVVKEVYVGKGATVDTGQALLLIG